MDTLPDLERHIQRVVRDLQYAVDAEFAQKYPNLVVPDRVTANPRRKFIAIDIGSSGAFLVERTTGELFNIKAYGVPDRNKKRKADIGNVATVDGAALLSKRYNYLR